jgi:hypothetical protein
LRSLFSIAIALALVGVLTACGTFKPHHGITMDDQDANICYSIP